MPLPTVEVVAVLSILNATFIPEIIVDKNLTAFDLANEFSDNEYFTHPASSDYANSFPVREFVNESVDPCDDFYEYVCGGWQSINEAHNNSDLNSVVKEVSFEVKMQLRDIIEKNDDHNYTFVAGKKAKVIYESCMNEESIKRKGIQPFLDFAATLGGWPVLDKEWNKHKFDWVELIAEMKLIGKNELFTFMVNEHPDEVLVSILRFFPVLYDGSSEPITILEEDLLMHVLNITGVPEGAKLEALKAITVFRDELIELTDFLMNLTESEKELRLTVRELAFLVPDFDWIKYFTIVQGEPLNITQEVQIGIIDIYYMHLLLKVIDRTTQETIANFLFWRLIVGLSDYFDTTGYDDYDDFEDRNPRFGNWNWCMRQIEHEIGDVLSAIYVQEKLTPSIEADMDDVIRNIKEAYVEIFEELEWSDLTTKRLVIDKLRSIQYDIGYPREILSFEKLNSDFENVSVSPDTFFENMIQIKRMASRKKNTCSETYFQEWPNQPTVVNAYYISYYNRVAVPIAILRPPYYHEHFPPSVVYSGVGEIISHEIMHAFDTSNRYLSHLNDTFGTLWQENSTSTPYDPECFGDMFSKYSINGEEFNWTFFQEETVADVIAIQAAFKAFQKVASNMSEETYTLMYDRYKSDLNLTDNQEFFVNFVQNRCERITTEMIDGATFFPVKIRVMAALTNFKKFATTFSCSAEQEMSPAKVCHVW